MPRNVIPTTIYFNSEEERNDAQAKADERDMSLAALVRHSAPNMSYQERVDLAITIIPELF